MNSVLCEIPQTWNCFKQIAQCDTDYALSQIMYGQYGFIFNYNTPNKE